MHVTIIHGSPGKEESNTSFVLTPLIKGMKQAGATVEIIYTSELDIKPCGGCFKCWRIHIGKCYMNDEMKDVLVKLKNTDLLVFATPVYSPLPCKFQNFLNRMVPLMEPVKEKRDGRTRIKFHEDVKISKIIAVVVGGWWEIENLSLPVKIFEEFSETTSTPFIGAIRRPHASFLQQTNEKTRKIRSALNSIGQMVIEKGTIDEEKLEIISQPLINEENFRETSNINYENRKDSQS